MKQNTIEIIFQTKLKLFFCKLIKIFFGGFKKKFTVIGTIFTQLMILFNLFNMIVYVVLSVFMCFKYVFMLFICVYILSMF